VAETYHVKTVLFISSWFPNRVTPFNGDFIERHALAVSRICRTGAIHVCADAGIHGRFMEIFEIQKDGLLEVLVYFRKIKTRFRFLENIYNILFYSTGYILGYYIIKKEIGRPDIIHANVIVPVSRVAWFLNKITGIPYIISEHWTAYQSKNRNDIPRNKKSVAGAYALVPVTESLREALKSFGYSGRYFVVPNVVDTQLFTPCERSDGNSRKRMLHVSSMKEEHKNISGIIQTLRKLKAARQDFLLTFVGGANSRQKEMVMEAGLNDHIVFAGEIEHRKVAEFMKQSDFLVMFSNVENLPCVIVEALACGLPVISTNVGGISEWIDEKNGILVERNNITALYQGINYLLDNHTKYNKDQLHDFAVKNFSTGVIAARFLEIYNQASNKQKK
jgi:glycosyltransferase involved in cell wall biosynthesis